MMGEKSADATTRERESIDPRTPPSSSFLVMESNPPERPPAYYYYITPTISRY